MISITAIHRRAFKLELEKRMTIKAPEVRAYAVQELLDCPLKLSKILLPE